MGNNKIISDIFDMKETFNIINAVVNECRLHISNDGWKVSTLDPANVASVTIELPKENFYNYNITDSFILK